MEYEKVRFDRLNQVVKKAVEHTIKKSLMSEQVYKCFPQISGSEAGREALENARKQMQGYFHNTCLKQVDHIFNERDIEQKLNDLDQIIQSAQYARTNKTRGQIQVDKLEAEELINAGLGESRRESEQKLALIYEQLVLDNQKIRNEIDKITEEGCEITDELVSSVGQVSGGSDKRSVDDFEKKYASFIDEFYDELG